MKQLIFIVALVMATFSLKAQNTLEFNRSLYLELTVAGTGGNYVFVQQSITVPSGKTWKIESAGASYRASGVSPSYSSSGVILLNDRIIDNPDTYTMPIWLPAGTYTVALLGGTNSNGYTSNGFISGIEFNITQ
jgi:hypothetical protein